MSVNKIFQISHVTTQAIDGRHPTSTKELTLPLTDKTKLNLWSKMQEKGPLAGSIFFGLFYAHSTT